MRWLILTILFSSSLMAHIHHDLNVILNPHEKSLAVVDQITFPENTCGRDLMLSLHKGLHPKIVGDFKGEFQWVENELVDERHELIIERYRLHYPCGANQLTFQYEGEIFHQITDPIDPYSRGTADSPGLISDDGVVLSAQTHWFFNLENIPETFVTFKMNVAAPPQEVVVSQGQEVAPGVWQELNPAEDIFLISAKFTRYEKTLSSGFKILAYLRTKDDQMARNYLEATATYIDRYVTLIGPFPYAKFALIENFWDTGFGMPSFTLLGSNIIRLPFIINTSYPHEILHDWWGNSVYVDVEKGNWCEGLTVYFADHLMAELNQNGANYRRDTLQKFTDFVTVKNDFPLTAFRERHDAPSEAIGYGKSMMFFHMLRQKVGDEKFIANFQRFYADQKFHEASFSDIKNAFGENLNDDFIQWTTRTGAPALKLQSVESTLLNNGKFQLTISLDQVQAEAPFHFSLPLAIHLEGEPKAYQTQVIMQDKTGHYQFQFDKRPFWLEIDPEFDVFRRIAIDEVPAVLTMSLGAKKTLFLLPSKASPERLKAYGELIEIVKNALPKESDMATALDSDLTELPSTSTVFWVLGRENKWRNKINPSLVSQKMQLKDDGILQGEELTPYENHSALVVQRDSDNKERLWTFLDADQIEAFPILANKIIHYGKYSYLNFEGVNVINQKKAVWSLTSSSLSIPIPQSDGKKLNSILGVKAPRKALVHE